MAWPKGRPRKKKILSGGALSQTQPQEIYAPQGQQKPVPKVVPIANQPSIIADMNLHRETDLVGCMSYFWHSLPDLGHLEIRVPFEDAAWHDPEAKRMFTKQTFEPFYDKHERARSDYPLFRSYTQHINGKIMIVKFIK